MPGGGIINSLDGLRFFKGYLYATPQGETPVRMVRFGALQNITVSHEWGLAEVRGPEALPPLGVGITQENLSGSAEFATILAAQAKLLLGATVSTASGQTTIRKLANAEPKPFDIHLETPDGGVDLQIDIYNCIAPTYQIVRADNRAWSMSNFAFTAYGKVISGSNVLFDIILPGNQTDSSTGAGTPLPTGGAGSSLGF